MSKPAARITDTAGHSGAIIIGEPTVLIGGFPAARVGDSIVCPGFDGPKPHVMGNILMGSTNVIIGGAFAARQGDPTGCGVAGKIGKGMPPMVGPNVVNANSKSSSEKNIPSQNNEDKGVQLLWGGIEENKDSVLLDASLAHDSMTLIGGVEYESNIAHVEGEYSALKMSKEKGISGTAHASVSAVDARASWESDTTAPSYVAATGELRAYTATSTLNVLAGTDGRRTGVFVNAEASASELEVQGSLTSGKEIPIPFTDYSFKYERTITAGAVVGGIGGNAYGGVYHDKKDNLIHGSVGGKLAALLGLDFDLSITFGFTKNKLKVPPNGVGIPMTPGSISTGCTSVLIGSTSNQVQAKKARYEYRISLINQAKNDPNVSPEKQKAAERLQLNNRAIERARLSNHIYDIDSPPPIGWKIKEMTPPDSDGFTYAVYESEFENPSKPVMVFRGTDNLKDWRSNFTQGSGFEDAQYNKSIKAAKQMKTKYPDGFEIAGHSKAGGQTTAAALATGQKGYAYNSAGVHENTLKKHGHIPSDASNLNSENQPLVDTFNFEHDPLSNLQETGVPIIKSLSPISPNIAPSASGKKHRMNSIDSKGRRIRYNPFNTIKYHGVNYIVDSMEYEKQQDLLILMN